MLVVANHVDTAEALELLLSQSGREVRVAHRGRQAIEVARVLEPDLAILDLGLPDMRGCEVARELRRLATRPLVVIALSGSEQRLREEPQHFDRALLKPVDAATLCQDFT